MANRITFPVVGCPSCEVLHDANRLVEEKRTIRIAWTGEGDNRCEGLFRVRSVGHADSFGDVWDVSGWFESKVTDIEARISTAVRTGAIVFILPEILVVGPEKWQGANQKLQVAGFDVLSVANGSDAIAAYRKKLPDMILINSGLGAGVPPHDLAGFIRNDPDPAIHRLPIVFLGEPDDIRQPDVECMQTNDWYFFLDKMMGVAWRRSCTV